MLAKTERFSKYMTGCVVFFRHRLKEQPYYFNDPEKHVSEKIVLGFGPHGLGSRVEGTTTDEFVAVVQRHIRTEVGALLARWLADPSDKTLAIGLGPEI